MAINDFDIESAALSGAGGYSDPNTVNYSDFSAFKTNNIDSGIGTSDSGMGANEKMAIAKTAVSGASGIAESMMNMFSNAKDRRAQESIDAMYETQEELDRIENERQKALAREEQRRADRLSDLRRSYIKRGKDFQSKLDAELERFERLNQYKDNAKSRLKTSDDLAEARRIMRGQ